MVTVAPVNTADALPEVDEAAAEEEDADEEDKLTTPLLEVCTEAG